MTRTTTPLPEVTEGATVSGGTHGVTPWTGTTIVIGDAQTEWYFVMVGGRLYEQCHRCDLSGHIAEYGFVHEGVCFECNGAGVHAKAFDSIEQAREVIRKRIMAKAARTRKAAREAEATQAAAAAWAADNTDLAAALAAVIVRVEAAQADDEYSDGGVNADLLSIAYRARHDVLSTKAADYAQTLLVRQADDDAKVAAKADAAAQSEYLGNLGDKVTVTGEAVTAMTFEREAYAGYGRTETVALVIVRQGNVYAKMVTTAAWAYDVERGEQITVTGAVKAHSEYQGTKQTVLVRPRKVA